MSRKEIRFGIIGLGLMGKEFGSAVARWCHLLDDGPVPVLTGICDMNEASFGWFEDNFPSIEVTTTDYQDILSSDIIDAVYCAVPHNLHEKLYIDIIKSGKHLLGEKPFGIDIEANKRIMDVIQDSPSVIVKCNSEFPYFPGAKRMIDWIEGRNFGRLIEVKCGFNHSSDMDLTKPINWKRIIEINGEYGCMGDLGLHTHHIPLRMGWKPDSVFAELSNISEQRPDGKGGMAECETWDNATLMCRCTDPGNGKSFPMILETKRMSPGDTNTWFIEVYGTGGSARFTTHDPKAFYYLETKGKEQGWTRVDIGPASFLPTITGGIFEFGFSDSFQQMLGAFMHEFKEGGSDHPFPNVSPEETVWSHQIMTAALESHKTGKRVSLV
ncbi:MAG: Gfo/Idh/MocA family oxidoreductase [Spirochaetaceae bacterium]|nr:Gfo/Idh/MocA family oxidoreductase [Spirochaetaceae bacterium]RKX90603.1 MAG: gfo/Idh/MocA family oxidoreductase [Spirochaetota bacterium]RKX98428.1 MAG: gfo/Idh/MocA family oxidoreductase [Spirochaetota bacterium]